MENIGLAISQAVAMVVIIAGAAAGISKAMVDAVRLAFPEAKCMRWVSPVLALVFSQAIVFLLLAAISIRLDGAMIATGILAGITAALGAMGITVLGKKAA